MLYGPNHIPMLFVGSLLNLFHERRTTWSQANRGIPVAGPDGPANGGRSGHPMPRLCKSSRLLSRGTYI